MPRTPLDPTWSESRVPGAAPIVDLAAGQQSVWSITCDEERRLDRGKTPLTLWQEFLGRLKRLPFYLGGARGELTTKPGANAVPVIGYHLKASEGVVSSLYRRSTTDWQLEFQLHSRLNTLAVLRDGSIVAGGDLSSVHQEGDEWRIIEAPARLVRVWGAHPRCVYALGERILGDDVLGNLEVEATWVESGLFFFDGEQWVAVDLTNAEINGMFAGGSCDSSGYGWIVGTYATHSCMARGRGTEWEPDMCGSWYLDDVEVQDGGVAYALGGDGLWRLRDDRWFDVEAYNLFRYKDLRWTRTLGVADGSPIVVTEVRGAAPDESTQSSFDVYVSNQWLTIEAPGGSTDSAGPQLHRVTPSGTWIVSQGQSVWESCPLAELAEPEWPPPRLTPKEDPQLAAAEPLVRSWRRLEGIRSMRFDWVGSTLVTAASVTGQDLDLWISPDQPPRRLATVEDRIWEIISAPNGRFVAVRTDGPLGGEENRRGDPLLLIDASNGSLTGVSPPSGIEFRYGASWSPDGDSIAMVGGHAANREKRVLLIYSVPTLTLVCQFDIDADLHPERWDQKGILLSEVGSSPLSEDNFLRLDVASGILRDDPESIRESPCGRYSIKRRRAGIGVTSKSDGSVRLFLPTPHGALERHNEKEYPNQDIAEYLRGASWVGDRLELHHQLHGPLLLDLESLLLRYAFPDREEGQGQWKWNRDGSRVIRSARDGYLWGEVEG